jgi:hypothetical protein
MAFVYKADPVRGVCRESAGHPVPHLAPQRRRPVRSLPGRMAATCRHRAAVPRTGGAVLDRCWRRPDRPGGAAARTARRLQQLRAFGFQLAGWSRTRRQVEGVACYAATPPLEQYRVPMHPGIGWAGRVSLAGYRNPGFMLLLRLMLTWLIMAAIPLQGFAAASMAFCKVSHHALEASAHDGGDRPGGTLQQDHSQRAQWDASPPLMQALDKTGDAKSLPDAGHKCGVCASCCHSLAMGEVPRWPAVAPIPQPEPAEVVPRIYAALTQLPDKPPRA